MKCKVLKTRKIENMKLHNFSIFYLRTANMSSTPLQPTKYKNINL